ncbi:metalloprotease [Mycena belliarum]|uniref:Metalloprotease n=1 Tax=Mycena belliarum TaxID=1033014 RepID=A0AAD6UDA3_9AGAR|nr:metalloprotease [Mycena belliae]
MLTTTTLTFLLTLGAVVANPTTEPWTRSRKCGTYMSDAKMMAAERHFVAQAAKILPEAKIANKAVKVYFHVISKDSTVAGGNVPAYQIANQMSVLNRDYGGNINWVLAGTTRTVNADWFNKVGPSSSQQTAMKAALRSGGRADLNVYTVGFKSGTGVGLLGYATFPFTYSSAPKDDGIVILFGSLPGGSTPRYNLGRTLTHETGHWLGLFHTFQGGCTSSGTANGGDFVADTPSQKYPSEGCPRGQDSCRGSSFPGSDAIQNFMDYSTDICMTQFSAGQIARATKQFATYRA